MIYTYTVARREVRTSAALRRVLGTVLRATAFLQRACVII